MVFTVPYVQCGRDGGLHDWSLEDAEVGGLYLYWPLHFCLGRRAVDRRLECHSVVGASCYHCCHVFPNIEDEMRQTAN